MTKIQKSKRARLDGELLKSSVRLRRHGIGAIWSILSLIWFFIFALPYAARSNQADSDLEYKNGYVSVQESNILLIEFLENLSESANLQILVVETIDPNQRIDVNFNHQQINEVVGSVLKGYNYGIIFNDPQINQATVFSYNANQRNQPADLDYSQTYNVMNQSAEEETGLSFEEIEDKRQNLTQEIDELNQRIESGVSDVVYEIWAEARDPKFVQHDRDKLELYQKQLSEL